MQANKKIRLTLFWILLLTGCIDPFTPGIDESQELLVIEGQLIDREGYQYIYVSRSSPFNNPQFFPESDCYVEVVDDQGNIFQFNEYEPGTYRSWINKESLVPGTSYKLRVITSLSEQYESDYDMLTDACPPIDSVYYAIETRETSDPDFILDGIQFYVDVDPGDGIERKFRWELTETWEYWARNIIQNYYDGNAEGKIYDFDNPWKYYRCWSTERISTIYTANTKYSTSNKIKKFPLNYVSNQSFRLKVKYSLLVKQFSLSDDAYAYWSELERQSQETGSLYETQPPQVKSNIHNVNNPDECVLGYFNVSAVAEKRIFVDEQFPFYFPTSGCKLDTVYTIQELRDLYLPYPVYLISLNPMGQGWPFGAGGGICFDCRNGGGTIEVPSFWK